MINLRELLDVFLIFIALLNPVSKIFIISTLSEDLDNKETRYIIFKSSIIAVLIFTLFAIMGNFILNKIFHVDIYSFQIAGGLILAYRGFQALNKGIFFEMHHGRRLTDVSIVPLASPMIAGPATITASVTLQTQYGVVLTLVAIYAAIIINLITMLLSKYISAFLIKYNIMGALIRIIGLVVATIGIQMVLDGVSRYVKIFIR